MAQGLSPEVVADTRRFWQERTGEAVSEEDAREIIRNLAGFFDLLHEWDQAAQGKPEPGELGMERGEHIAKDTVA
ncbi:hypothetical protein LLH23_15105 [bacterium]|nr:hypothetical protein [bacterium]